MTGASGERKAPPRFPAARSTSTGIGRLAESLALAAETAKTPGEGSVRWTSPLSEPKE